MQLIYYSTLELYDQLLLLNALINELCNLMANYIVFNAEDSLPKLFLIFIVIGFIILSQTAGHYLNRKKVCQNT